VDLPIWERRERRELLAQIHAPDVHRTDIQAVASILEHGIGLALYACMANQHMIPFRSTQVQIYYQRFADMLFNDATTINDFGNYMLGQINQFHVDSLQQSANFHTLLVFVKDQIENMPIFPLDATLVMEQQKDETIRLINETQTTSTEYQMEIDTLQEQQEKFNDIRFTTIDMVSMITHRKEIIEQCGKIHKKEEDILKRCMELSEKMNTLFTNIDYNNQAVQKIMEAKAVLSVLTPMPKPTSLMEKRYLTVTFLSILQSSAELLSKMLKLTRQTDIQIAEDNIDRSIEELLLEIDLDFNKRTPHNERVDELRRRVANIKTNSDLVSSVGDWLNERHYGENEFISDHLAEKRQRVMLPIDSALSPEIW
jgi:hypothetical protein